ncbi:AraC family transcriptional regulator [Prauserella sp. PE36]|uniref:AraC family transcriptional regulator n=1 Tax=Prauserella sp. PE36 TaxID=1504709 RepID=UPI000DE2EB53|nr:AraC family transcriptional regulator [Prauserella sp. PE36]RBM13590.1 AraC family transcriptional regulator [Prauserella sp. PE36]
MASTDTPVNRLPLDRHPLFRSSDVDETRETMARVLCDHRLEVVDTRKPLDARMHSCRLNAVSLNYVHYGTEVEVTPGKTESFHVVQAHLDGNGVVRCGKREAYTEPGHAAVTTPTAPLRMRLSGTSRLLVVRFERTAVEAVLARHLGHPLRRPLEFELGMNVGVGRPAHWFSSLEAEITRANLDDTLLSDPRVVAPLEEQLITGLLLVQDSNYRAVLDGKVPSVPGGTVRTAVDLIEAAPDLPHTVGDLAAAAGVGIRALQGAFRRQLGVTPTQYLRDARLRRVRDELLAAEPDAGAVSRAARRWGFGHLGRFSGWYRHRFGENPAQTLRQ